MKWNFINDQIGHIKVSDLIGKIAWGRISKGRIVINFWLITYGPFVFTDIKTTKEK